MSTAELPASRFRSLTFKCCAQAGSCVAKLSLLLLTASKTAA